MMREKTTLADYVAAPPPDLSCGPSPVSLPFCFELLSPFTQLRLDPDLSVPSRSVLCSPRSVLTSF